MTRAKAIAKKCLECSGDSPKEVTMCHIFDCPLWPYRTGTSTKSNVYKERMKKAQKNFSGDFKELSSIGINIADFLLCVCIATVFLQNAINLMVRYG